MTGGAASPSLHPNCFVFEPSEIDLVVEAETASRSSSSTERRRGFVSTEQGEVLFVELISRDQRVRRAGEALLVERACAVGLVDPYRAEGILFSLINIVPPLVRRTLINENEQDRVR